MKAKKIRKVSFNLAGGNAGKNSKSYKLSIPSEWINTLGIDENNKYVEIEINDDNIITIKKSKIQ